MGFFDNTIIGGLANKAADTQAGKKKGPAPPDYMGLAEKAAQSQQQAIAAQTWANRADQTNPWGTTKWTQHEEVDPATGQKVTKWNQEQSLDPQLDAALNSQQGLQQDRSQLAQGMFGNVAKSMGQPMDYSGFTSWGDPSQMQAGGLQAYTSAFGFGGPQQSNIDTSRSQVPQLNYNLGQGAGQGLQRGLDFGGTQGVQGSDASRQRAENAIYQSSTSRLDPQWQQKQAQLDSQLATRGVTRGSAAYQQAQQGLGMQRNDAYQQAQMGAITGAGAEAQRNQGMDLALHGQQTGDISQQGQFQNAAQQQAYQQMLGAGQAQNAAMGQGFSFGQDARQQQLAAQQAQFGQGLQGGQFDLAQQQQAFGQQQQAGSQNFQQQLQLGQYQNQQRQQQIAEALQQRGMSLNEINALLQGQQVGTPNFGGYANAAGGQGTDYMGAGQQQANAAQQQFAQQQAQQQQTMGAAAGLIGAFMGSDRALKKDIRRIGRHARGFGIYSYRFIGERGRRVGVIAQEVQRIAPELVRRGSGGFLQVNYGGL